MLKEVGYLFAKLESGRGWADKRGFVSGRAKLKAPFPCPFSARSVLENPVFIYAENIFAFSFWHASSPSPVLLAPWEARNTSVVV
jgi:hypothetical protein